MEQPEVTSTPVADVPPTPAYRSVTHDGVTVDSNTGTEAELRAEVESFTAKPDPKTAEKPEAKAEGDRNADGTFKPKAPSNRDARRDPEARIAQAIAQRETERRRAEAAERRIAEIEAARKPAERAEPAKDEPAAEKFPKFADYVAKHPDAEFEDWMEARDAWKEDQLKAQFKEKFTARQQETAMARRAATFAEQVTEAGGPEFLKAISEDVINLRTRADLRPGETPTALVDFAEELLDSPVATKVMQHLTAHPEELQRFAALPSKKHVLKEFAKLEDRFQRTAALPERDSADPTTRRAAPSTGPARPETPKSQASDPITPVRGSTHVADSDANDDDSDDDFYRKEQAKLMAKRRRR